MATTSNKFIVLTEGNIEKRSGESWPEMLHRWLVRCPKCEAQWLVIGVRENDRHVCKDCGHGFAIGMPVASKAAFVEMERDVA